MTVHTHGDLWLIVLTDPLGMQTASTMIPCPTQSNLRVLCVLLLYILATFKFTYRQIHTCDKCAPMTSSESCPTGRPSRHLISHSVTLSWHWTKQSLPYPINVEHLDRERQASIFKSLVWINQGSYPRGSNHPISQTRRGTLYSFGHPVWSRVGRSSLSPD